MTDDDLIRRGDALAIVVRDRVPTNRTGSEFRVVSTQDMLKAIAALPAVKVAVKPLVFRDETGDGVLTSRETGELFRIFPQKHGGFVAPKLPEPDCYADDAQTLIDRLNARWSARILAALEPVAAPAWLSNCVVCGRIVDTREREEGGDAHGCEYAEGWTCSSDCAETLHPDPDWMKEGLAAPDPAAIREAALREALDCCTDYGFTRADECRDAILALIQKGGDAYAVDPRHAPHEASPGVTAGAIPKGDADDRA